LLFLHLGGNSRDLLEALVMGFGAQPQHFVLGVSTLHFRLGVVFRSTTDLSRHGVFSARLHHAIELLDYKSKSFLIISGDSCLSQVLYYFSSHVSTLLLDSQGTDLVRDGPVFIPLRYLFRQFGWVALQTYSNCLVVGVPDWVLNLSLFNTGATGADGLLKGEGAAVRLAPRASSIEVKLLVGSTDLDELSFYFLTPILHLPDDSTVGEVVFFSFRILLSI